MELKSIQNKRAEIQGAQIVELLHYYNRLTKHIHTQN